jgi:LuxR family maltose regulon positive regulatory protein
VADPFWGEVCQARILLAAGDLAGAHEAAGRATTRCVRHVVLRDLLLARTAPSNEAAVELAGSAVERATAAGLLQTLASEGPEAVELVELAAWRAPEQWLDRLRRAAVPVVDQALLDDSALLESLTSRERGVLRLLASRLTLREIADELGISTNTLKFHLKVVYRKLGCSSRAEAVELARSRTRLHKSPPTGPARG